MTTTSNTQRDYIAEHNTLIAKREQAQGSGTRAAISRALSMLELDMTLENVDFRPYQPVTNNSAASLGSKTDAELVKMHQEAVAKRETVEGSGKRASATLAIRRLEQVLQGRSVKFTPWAGASQSNAHAMDDESLLTRLHKVRALLSKDLAPKLKRTAEREERHLSDLAHERGLNVSGSVKSEPRKGRSGK
jgi:hypothetical protein